MSYVWFITRFDGHEWRPVAGDEYVTPSGAHKEANRLNREHPAETYRVQRSRPGFLSQFVQQVQ